MIGRETFFFAYFFLSVRMKYTDGTKTTCLSDKKHLNQINIGRETFLFCLLFSFRKEKSKGMLHLCYKIKKDLKKNKECCRI